MKNTARTLRLRSTPTFATSHDLANRIDRDNAIIYGVTAMQSGVEAIGHGVMADQKTLEMMAVLGNAHPSGVRQRFGHPGMSENAAGKKVAVGRNFRVDDDRLVHDAHMLESARKSPVFSQDPVEFVLSVAETAPQEFGESVVISADLVWTFEDGSEIPATGHYDDEDDGSFGTPDGALTELPVMRPQAFHYVDFVNEGALTHNGMFSASVADSIFAGTSSEYLHQLFELVDQWRAQYGVPLDSIPDKLDRILHSYVVARGGPEKGADFMSNRRGKRKRRELSLGTDGTPVLGEDVVVDAVVDDPVEGDAGEEANGVEQLPEDDAAVEQLPVGETAEEGEESVDGALDAAEEQLAAMAAETAELESQDGFVDLIGRDEFDTHRNQLATLAGRVEKLTAQLDRTATLLTQNLEATAAIHRNQQKLAGEPVVTERVARAPETQLEPVGYAHPQPGAFAMNAQPTHVTERMAKGRTETAEQRALRVQQERRRHVNLLGE